MYVDYEADLRQYNLWRFALDEGGGMIDAVTRNGVRDKNKLLEQDILGVFHGTPTWGHDNEVGYYLNTDTNKYLDQFGKLVQPGTTVSFSVSTWLKFGSGFGNYPLVISELQAGTNIGWGLEVFASTPNHGAPYVIAYDGTHQLNNYSSSIPACENSKWHLVCAIWNRINQTLGISIDVGTLFTSSIATLGSMNGDGTASMKIGQNTNLAGTGAFTGSIHDMRVYRNRILNTQDMLRIYQNKKLRKLGPDLALPPWVFSQPGGAVAGGVGQSAVSIIG